MKTKIAYQIFVNGIPRAQPRPRLGKYGNFYSNSENVEVWKEAIIANFLNVRQPPISGPICLRVCFYLPVPKSMKIKDEQIIPHDKKPDLDNLLKAVLDAISNAGVWNDDAQVYATDVSKWYSLKKTGVQIIIEKKS